MGLFDFVAKFYSGPHNFHHSQYHGFRDNLHQVIISPSQMWRSDCCFSSQSFAPLALGRGLSSFGLGLGVMMPFVLISEITTIKVCPLFGVYFFVIRSKYWSKARAPLSVVNTMSISFGILASYVFIFALPAFYLIFFAAGLSLLFLVLSPFLPESPHFLVTN